MTVDVLPNLPLPEEKPMLTLDEARVPLRIGRSQAYSLARSGDFPCAVVRVGERYRVPTAALRALLGI
jgi:hypothetical protein